MKIRLIGALALAVFAISAPLASATDSELILPVEVTICPTTIITSETAREETVDVSVSGRALSGYERHPEDDKDEGDARLKASDDCVALHPGPPDGVDHGDGRSIDT